MVAQIEAEVIKDGYGFYPDGCIKTIQCGLQFLRDTFLSPVDVYDEDCPTKLTGSRGKEVKADYEGAIPVRLFKGEGGYLYTSMTLTDYLTGCNCCVGDEEV